MENDTIKEFRNFFLNSIEKMEFVKLSLSKSVAKNIDLKNIYASAKTIKNEIQLSLTFRYRTRDEVKNFNIDDGINFIMKKLGGEFLNADLYTISKNYSIKFNKKRIPSLIELGPTHTKPIDLKHNKTKKRFICAKNNIYLQELGVVSSTGLIVKNKEDKFKQINKFIEIIDGLVKNISFDKEIKIVDMGSGKGYLTFAVYDYLKNTLGLDVRVKGIETQKKLVDICNSISAKAKFENLSFVQENITDFHESEIDILISLHACDTATDDTLYYGIKTNARLIVSSPCCHKQVRKQMNESKKLMQLNKFGILRERQAEIITDAIRANLLELNGYKTNIIEFISSEYTGKNLLIIASKTSTEVKKEKILLEIDELKNLFGIEYHYLEKLLSDNQEDNSWKNLNPVCHVH